MRVLTIFSAFVIVIISNLGICAQGVQNTPSPVSQSDGKDERYRIGYQDTLEVQVFRHPDLNRRVTVNPNGTINLFRLDEPLVAVCKTETELAKDIEKAYEKDYLRNPEVSVLAVERKSQSVAVMGAVQKPGNFYIDKRFQLLEMIAFAGGPKVEDVGTRIAVVRTGGRSNCQMDNMTAQSDENSSSLMFFRIRDVQEGKQTLWMQPGDIVSVLPADVVYVYGNVNEQGAVKMKEPITLTQALVLAKGLKSASDKGKIRVLRQKPGSLDREEMVFDLSQIDKGKLRDPFLEPNDIVAVSEDKAKSILNSISRSFTQGIPSIFYRVPL